MTALRFTTSLSRNRHVLAWLAVLLLGTIVRVALILTPQTGHDADQQLFVLWTRNLTAFNLSSFYANTSFCNYPPLMLLILWAIGESLTTFTNLLSSDVAMRMVIKTPAALADLILAICLFYHVRRTASPSMGVAAAALYYLNPATIYVSAYWGQVDSIHTLFLVAALMTIDRSRWSCTGIFSALALLQKFQSISILPLILFETFRLGSWRGLSRWCLGAAVAAAAVLSPFFFSGVLETALRRGYVEVVGQYNDLSRNAFNLWYLIATPTAADTSAPPVIAAIVADGRTEFPANESWLLFFTWRHISLILYSLCVACILTLYSLRAGRVMRYAAAGALGMAFFMIPTEMHERYALPVLALAAPWAVTAPWRERLYVLISAFLTLNLVAVIPPEEIAGAAAVMLTAAFVATLGWLAFAAFSPDMSSETDRTGAPTSSIEPPASPAHTSNVIPAFRWLTASALAGTTALTGWIVLLWLLAPAPRIPSDSLMLSGLTPASASQSWGTLQINRAVSGSVMRIADTYYLFGLGTHAPGNIQYRIPPGFDEFQATVGIDQATAGRGTVSLSVEVEGETRFQSPVLTGLSAPVEIRVPVTGASSLTLRADSTRDGTHFDHVNWASARLIRRTAENSAHPAP